MNPFNVSTLCNPGTLNTTSLCVRLRVIALSVITVGLITPVSLALESDLNKPVYFTSDTLELDELKGTTTYIGKVVVERGSMRINADVVTVYYSEQENSSVTKIVAQGKPASYQQKPTENKDLIIAKANTLEYSLKDESLHLIEAASLKQGGTSLTGKRIDYDARHSIVKAGGSLDRKERVRMVIPPKALQQNGANDKNADNTSSDQTTLPKNTVEK